MKRPSGAFVLHALAGILAATFGMAAAHLVASLMNPQSSPVLAVGATVIDATPTPVKEWAVRNFGTHDKPILIGNVLVITLIAAGVAGVLARRRLALGLSVTFVLVALAGAAALHRPTAEVRDGVPAIVAAVLGPLSLWWLVRALRSREGTAVRPDDEREHSRRGFLIGSGALLLGGAVAAGAGQWIIKTRSRISGIVLPRPVAALPPLPAGLEDRVPGISPFRTSNRRFYRVDTKLSVPIVDQGSWTLEVDGLVRNQLAFSYDDILAMALEEHDITLTCVSNEVGGRYLGAARWLGVPLKRILDLADVSEKADQLLSTDVDGFQIGTPMTAVLDGRDALLAVGMNGEVLPREHGFPARLVVPGLYGFVSATKWVTRLTATTYAEDESYWTKRDWANDAPIKLSSRIDTPKPLSTIGRGRTAVGGVAWAQHDGVERVEVSIDGGSWQQATLGPDAGIDYWRQWYLPWDAAPGSHRLAVRAISRSGTVQTPVRAGSFPDGSSGIQQIVVTVT
jgi:DMSO/TMAO reductase YedYZ molybdopterin-dependent catalytic subunit